MTMINKLLLTLLVFLSGCYPREDPGEDIPIVIPDNPGYEITIDTAEINIITDTIYIYL